MVEIRKLTPAGGGVRLRIPPKQVTNRNYRQVAERRRTERRRDEFPPPTPQPTPCVLWQGSVDQDGYGRRKALRPGADHPQTIGVHRWIVEVTLGRRLRTHEIIMHLCDNRLCYRHDHLRIGSIQENNKDRDDKGRLVHVAQRMYGARNGNSKLTAEQVSEIRAMRQRGITQQVCGTLFGVSRQVISQIDRGLTWIGSEDGSWRLEQEEGEET